MSDAEIAERPGETVDAEFTVRVERGRASAEELAALTVVLLGLQARTGSRDAKSRRSGSWWWGRPAAYQAPTSWQYPSPDGA
ncbi:acyl-CoA carboxylase subunit epsilon [Streptomyces sp. NPDC006739]|uniref:acyl-CoA carboxylase subunit epsilon n=1 Tax=Streptomyces sp. NPDC006739 TaxID=3364763 RepID=UPI0036A58456